MTGFTKGPWVCKKTEPISHSPFREYEINRPDGWTRIAKVVVSVSSMADDYAPARDLEANAHLIAAAPDLYEALETLMNEYSEVIREYKGVDVGSCGDVAYDVSGVALAKARGEV